MFLLKICFCPLLYPFDLDCRFQIIEFAISYYLKGHDHKFRFSKLFTVVNTQEIF